MVTLNGVNLSSERQCALWPMLHQLFMGKRNFNFESKNLL